jgi:hypothetical protein
MPFSIDSTTAALTASCMPKSSQLTISTRASGAKPNSSLDSRSTRRHSADRRLQKHDAVPAPNAGLAALWRSAGYASTWSVRFAREEASPTAWSSARPGRCAASADAMGGTIRAAARPVVARDPGSVLCP